LRVPPLTLVATALRWLLGGLFLWAGAVKLAAPKGFARAIDAFGLVPEPLLPPLAIGLPLLEFGIGMAVIRRWRGGLPAMAGLLLVFMAVLGYGVAQNLSVDCGCFSVAEQAAHTSLRTALGRDLLMLTGVVILGMLTRTGRKCGLSSTVGVTPAHQVQKETGR